MNGVSDAPHQGFPVRPSSATSATLPVSQTSGLDGQSASGTHISFSRAHLELLKAPQSCPMLFSVTRFLARLSDFRLVDERRSPEIML